MDVKLVQLSPQDRVRNCSPEQIVGFLCASALGGCCASYTRGARAESFRWSRVSVSPVPQIMEAVVEVFPPTPQERVQNRTPVCRLLGSLSLRSFMRACRIVRWSRFRYPQCLRSRKHVAWKLCVLHHRSACRIVLGSSLLMCQCSTSWSKLPGRSSALEKCSLCFIIVMTRLAQWTLWASTSRVWTRTPCLVLEMPALHMEEPVPQIAEDIVERLFSAARL